MCLLLLLSRTKLLHDEVLCLFRLCAPSAWHDALHRVDVQLRFGINIMASLPLSSPSKKLQFFVENKIRHSTVSVAWPGQRVLCCDKL